MAGRGEGRGRRGKIEGRWERQSKEEEDRGGRGRDARLTKEVAKGRMENVEEGRKRYREEG